MLNRFARFTLAIAAIHRCWHKLAAEEMAAYDLNSPHAIYLTALAQYEDGLTAAKQAVEHVARRVVRKQRRCCHAAAKCHVKAVFSEKATDEAACVFLAHCQCPPFMDIVAILRKVIRVFLTFLQHARKILLLRKADGSL